MIFLYIAHHKTITTNIEELFNNVYISVNSRFLFAQETLEGYEFREIYRENEHSPLHIINIGEWEEYSRNFSKKSILLNFYQQRKEFENVTLRVGMLNVIFYFSF